MIFCLLIRVSRNQQGVPIRKESTVAGESIQIGRGAACKIRLFDHRVALHHATLRQSKDGELYIEAEGEASLKINGVVEQNASLPPGARVEIGPYLLVVDPASNGPYISLSVEAIPLPSVQGEKKARRAGPLTLSDLGMSKRKLSFGLAVCILFLFLLLPLLPGVSSELDKWQSSLPVTLTDSWSPGPLSGGHGVFGAKCSSCHQRAFRAISDDACTACHKKVGKHLTDDALHASLFKDVRCTECHVDHKGAAGLTRHDSSRCVACHGDIKSRSAKTTVANVHEFSTDHPPFRITVQNGKDGRPVIRALQNQKGKALEQPGLKFSHQVHLDKNGVSSPEGDTVMSCHDCHRPDEPGIHFEPMTMKKTCQQSGCHGLDFTAPVEGMVPHGSEREVMNRMRSYYAKWLVSAPENMAECGHNGSPENSPQRTLACAAELAQRNAAASLFSKNAGCAECHEIAASDDSEVPWKVTPVRLNRNWHAKSVFSHAKHDTTDCTACHDKTNSKTSADIAMPTIEKCRECHVGDQPVKGKVRSTCDSCHRFHGGGDAVK